jgi:hypothetical protein
VLRSVIDEALWGFGWWWGVVPALVRYYFDPIAGFESCGGVSFCLVGIMESLQDIFF